MRLRAVVWSGVALAMFARGVVAEPLYRLRGNVISASGEPVASASLRVYARLGFGGGQFTGQRTYETTTNAKGEWTIIGFTAGVWVFEASAPGYLPDAMALPFNPLTPAGQNMADSMPTWQPVQRLAAVPNGEAGRLLVEAADAAHAGNLDRVTSLLKELGNETDVEIVNALGHTCLVTGDAPMARAFFRRAQDRDPTSFAAALGMASTALLQKDFDTAARAFGTARDLTTNKAEQAYITAAVHDLSKIHVTAPGSHE